MRQGNPSPPSTNYDCLFKIPNLFLIMEAEISTSVPERALYYVNGSIPSWRVMLLLRELGVDASLRRLRVMVTPKETQSPEFLAINPKGGTPTLVENDGTVLTEHW